MIKKIAQITVFLCLVCLFAGAPAIWAEEKAGLQLDLKSERVPTPALGGTVPEHREGAFNQNPAVSPRSLGEFNVSLDNQLVPQRTLADTVRPTRDLIDLPRAGSFVLSQEAAPDAVSSPDMAATEAVVEPESEKNPAFPTPSMLSSTFTFRPGYLQTQLPDRFSDKRNIPDRNRSGRLTVSGGHEKEVVRVPQLTTIPSLGTPRIFANRVRPNGTMPAAAPGSLIQLPGTPSPLPIPPVTDNYFLEATYNFNPAVQGKVSYQRSQVDPTLKTENLQVEGTVDTGKNTAIKAGFQNRTTPQRPDVRSGDKKVFTEFILKF